MGNSNSGLLAMAVLGILVDRGLSFYDPDLNEDDIAAGRFGDQARTFDGRGSAEGEFSVSCTGQFFKHDEPQVAGRHRVDELDYLGCSFAQETCEAVKDFSEPYCLLKGECISAPPTKDKPGGPLERIVVLTQSPIGSHYNLLVQSLSRVLFMRREYWNQLANPTSFFHVPYVNQRTQDFMRLLGVPTSMEKSRLVDGHWKMKAYVWPPSHECIDKGIGGADAVVIADLRKTMTAALKVEPPSEKTVLLVKRSSEASPDGAIQNYDDIKAMVISELSDWMVTELSDAPSIPDIATSCKAFAKASLIIAPQSDLLTYLFCARTGTPVVEIRRQHKSLEAEYLAIKLRLPYVGVETDNPETGPGSVDVQFLKQKILEALHPGSPPPPRCDDPWKDPRYQPINVPLILKGKTPKDAEVHLIQSTNPPLTISCKGQVFNGTKALTHPHQGALIHTYGCDFNGGTCVWQSDVSGVYKKRYCLAGDPPLCVEHGPGEDAPGGPLEQVVVLTQPQWGAYYHFLVDSLSRVSWVAEQFPQLLTDPNTHFHLGLVNEVGQEWARLAGIPTKFEATRIIDGFWYARKVYFPPSNGCANQKIGADVFAVRWVRNTVTPKLWTMPLHPIPDIPNPSAKPRVVVIRRDPRIKRYKDARVILNHDEVIQQLTGLLPGWEVVTFSDYPSTPGPIASCQLFNSAQVIVGPHGAGFSNLVCAKEGTVVIEFQQKYHSWDFELMSAKLGLPYWGVRTKLEHLGPASVGPFGLRQAVHCIQAHLETAKKSAGAVAELMRQQQPGAGGASPQLPSPAPAPAPAPAPPPPPQAPPLQPQLPAPRPPPQSPTLEQPWKVVPETQQVAVPGNVRGSGLELMVGNLVSKEAETQQDWQMAISVPDFLAGFSSAVGLFAVGSCWKRFSSQR